MSVAIDNATQWKNLLVTMVEVNLLLWFLHKMDKPGDPVWFEDFLDNMSVQAVLYNAPETVSDIAKTRTHADFFSSVGET